MGVGDVVLTVFVIVLIVIFLAVSILYLVPFPVKANFDTINRKYLYTMVSSGGLTVIDIASLNNELTNAGYLNVNVNVSIKGTVKLGEELHFEVTAIYEKSNISLFNNTKQDVTLSP